MALRSSWEGFLRFNLIAVPVKAYSAGVASRGKIGFHLLHAKCHSRIRYQKVCPIHGEVSKDEIVSGYEYAKGQYVLIDPEEIAQLRPGADKSINIDAFIRPADLDPMYFTERTYFLAPDGKVGQKSYAVLQKVMAEEERWAVATMILAGRENVVAVRPVGRLLAVTVLSFSAQLKKPAAFDDEIPDVQAAAEEVKLARTLIEGATAEEFDFGKYEDQYTGQVAALIERKAKGKKVVAARKEEEPAVINLMDALRQSLEATRSRKGKPRRPHPPRSHAPRRKTG